MFSQLVQWTPLLLVVSMCGPRLIPDMILFFSDTEISLLAASAVIYMFLHASLSLVAALA